MLQSLEGRTHTALMHSQWHRSLCNGNATLYETTCKDVKQKLYGVAAYKAYSNRASTVSANDANAMPCRVQHLAAAAVTGGADTHCPHAQPTAAGPCATEMLKTFDCTLYETTCKDVKQKLYGVAAYEAYSNCASKIAMNDANAMSCRVQHLANCSYWRGGHTLPSCTAYGNRSM